MTPIPQPGEIVSFILRNFTNIDAQRNYDLDQKLKRMAKDGYFFPDDANELLGKRVKGLLTKCAEPSEICNTLQTFKNHYLFSLSELECGYQTPNQIRLVFDKYAVSLFATLLRPFAERMGFDVEQVIGHPECGVSVVWKAYLKDSNIRLASKELSKSIVKEEDSWATEISRWVRGNGMRVTTTLDILEKFDFDLGFALALANAYRRYCDFALVDAAGHASLVEQSKDAVLQDVKEINSKALEQLTKRKNDALVDICALVSPERIKLPSDSERVPDLISKCRSKLIDPNDLIILAICEGQYHAQMGELNSALSCFDKAAEGSFYRSASTFETALTYLFAVSAARGEKQIKKRWKARCEAIELQIMPQSSSAALNALFPNPYPDVSHWPPQKLPNIGTSGIQKWANKKPALSNPNRMIQGFGTTPVSQLQVYARFSQIDKIQLLLDNNADANKLDKERRSPLFFAIKTGSQKCYELLAKHTSSETINTQAVNGESCLHEAIEQCFSDLVSQLVAQGADIELNGPDSCSPLFEAVRSFRSAEERLDEFIDPVYRTNRAKRWPDSLRQSASPFSHCHAKVWEAGLKQNPEVIPQMYQYFSDKAKASHQSRKKIVSCLLDAGADVNSRAPFGSWTPFLYSARIGDPWLFRTLFEHGGNVRSQLDGGETALYLLYEHQHFELANWLFRMVSHDDRIWLREARPTS